ncbi:MAG: cupin domain-containing protein [Candidatus Dormibacteria bacterium]
MIRETAEQTGGERLTFELFLSPRGRVPAGHIHPRQVETFTVLRGRMRFRRGLRVLYAGPGESVTMPPGTFHTFLNPGDEPAQVVVQTSPALRMEEMLRAGAELGRRRALGLSRWRWAMEGVAFLREYRVEVAPPLVPPWALALVAQLAGKGQRPRPLPAATPARPSQAGFQP